MAKFNLNPKLDPKNYKISDDISNIKDWKARIISGNSMSDDKKVGDWEEVGYVWISLVDNTIIPLARSDEHHQGYDCIVENLKINASDYHPVFLGGDCYSEQSKQYPYNQEEAAELKISLLKLQYYGRDLDSILVSLSYILNDWSTKPITGTKFVEEKYGKEKWNETELTPLATKLIKSFEKLSKTYQALKDDKKSSEDLINDVTDLYDTCNEIKFIDGTKLFNNVMLEDVYNQINRYENGQQNFLEGSLFGFGGIRNQIHNSLRHYINNDDLNNQLGSVSKVVEMLSAI